MLKLLFIRHGESVDNRQQRITGQGESPLTNQGRLQCQQLAQKLHQQNWQPSHVYASPLSRVLASIAELVKPWNWQFSPPLSGARIDNSSLMLEQKTTNYPKTKAPPYFAISLELREFDTGILTGLTWLEAQQHYPNLCQALETSLNWVPIPEAETPLAGRDRAARFIQQLLTKHRNGDTVWIVSHHWIMEHLIACLMGCDRTWQLPILNTAVFEFWLDRDRWSEDGVVRGISDFWQIKRFNDLQHLVSTKNSTT